MLAAYVLGSLAHGGFSALVSDVDLGLVLDDPLEASDADSVRELTSGLAGSGLELGDRLSVFWGSHGTLTGASDGGRFPALDRLDLILHGKLLTGCECRMGLPRPTRRELVTGSAELGLNLLNRPSHQAWLADPASLLHEPPKPLTKAVLFPVRFLYTARTGEIGRNHDAVRHLAGIERSPIAELATAALRWRDAPPDANDAQAGRLVETGLRPMYQLFVKDHRRLMVEWGESDLVARLDDGAHWLQQLPSAAASR